MGAAEDALFVFGCAHHLTQLTTARLHIFHFYQHLPASLEFSKEVSQANSASDTHP